LTAVNLNKGAAFFIGPDKVTKTFIKVSPC
jgi:hypothetical protein